MILLVDAVKMQMMLCSLFTHNKKELLLGYTKLVAGLSETTTDTKIEVLDLANPNKACTSPLNLPRWLLLGSPKLMDPHPSQQYAGLQHAA